LRRRRCDCVVADELHVNSLAVMAGLLALAALFIFSAHPVSRAVPSTYFTGIGAAGAIALISSIGVSSGVISSWVTG
jgi:hypothetical protein